MCIPPIRGNDPLQFEMIEAILFPLAPLLPTLLPQPRPHALRHGLVTLVLLRDLWHFRAALFVIFQRYGPHSRGKATCGLFVLSGGRHSSGLRCDYFGMMIFIVVVWVTDWGAHRPNFLPLKAGPFTFGNGWVIPKESYVCSKNNVD